MNESVKTTTEDNIHSCGFWEEVLCSFFAPDFDDSP